MRPAGAHRPFSGAHMLGLSTGDPVVVILIIILVVLGIIVLLRHLVR